MKKKLVCLLLAFILVFAAMSFTACKEKEVEPTTTPDKQETDSGSEATPEPTATPEPKYGARLDSITIKAVDEAAAVTQLQAGDIDIFAGSLPGIKLGEIQDAGLHHVSSSGLSYEIMTNNADTVEAAGTFNPLSIREFREGMQWIIDRDYIASEIFGGAAIPRFSTISSFAPDYARYIEYARVMEAQYAYNKEKGVEAINAAMEAAGKEKNADGKWLHDGEPITLIFLIRTEDGLRKPIGDYVSDLLEEVGFVVDRQYKTSAECSPFWAGTAPAEGQWHLYTGAWGASSLARDSAIYFHDFDSPDSRYGYMPWTAFVVSEEYNDVMTKLANADFTTMEEREELFKEAFSQTCYYSNRIWIADGLGYTPWNENVSTSYNLSAGVDNDMMTAYTIAFNDKEGGDLVWGNSSPPLTNPVNPVAGTNWTYDSQYINLTRDYCAIGDPFTGLRYPKRLEKGEVVIQEGLPVGKTYDWVDLSFEKEIKVPDDAMVDWDVESETWLTADKDYFAAKLTKAEEAVQEAEATLAASTEEDKSANEAVLASAQEDLEAAQALVERGYQTSKLKAVYHFGKDLGEFTWHDGTPITLADIMMAMIMPYAVGYEESPLYDEYASEGFLTSLPTFKGWRIVSEDPIVIEHYSDNYVMDAENNISPLIMGWTYDSTGAQSSWYGIAAGNLVALSGKATYSEGKASEDDSVEWLNYIDGVTKDYLLEAFQQGAEEGYIPFEATMGKYVTKEEAKQAYENTLKFYEENDHFFIGCGPYYAANVESVAGTITLKAYEGYKEDMNRWSFLSEPKLATVEVDGPSSVSGEATFEVYIDDPAGEPYPIKDMAAVKYLLFDSKGEVAEVMDVTSETDGIYTITLTDETIAKLGKGSCKMEVVVSPAVVAAPSITPVEFVVE